VILDWRTGLGLREQFPDLSVFAPLKDGLPLPYPDGTIDVVAIPDAATPEVVAEAHRVAGLAVAVDHRALVVVPFLLLDPARPRTLRAALAASASYVALVVPVALLDPSAFLERAIAPATAGPGLGVANLLAYRGAESLTPSLWPLTALVPLGATVWLLRRPWSALARAGIASLVVIVLAPAVSANAVAVPILLLTLAVVERRDEPREANGMTGRTETETDKRPDGLG